MYVCMHACMHACMYVRTYALVVSLLVVSLAAVMRCSNTINEKSGRGCGGGRSASPVRKTKYSEHPALTQQQEFSHMC